MRRTVWPRFLAVVSLGAGILSANTAGFSVQTLYSSGSSISQLNSWLASNGATAMWIGTSGTDMIYTGSGIVTLNTNGPVLYDPSGSFKNDVFLIASPNGSLDGWQQSLGSSAETLSSLSAAGRGLADASVNGYEYIYVANSSVAGINVVKTDPNAPNLSGNFKDPYLSGYTVSDIQNINGTLYVSFVNSAGNAVIDTFDANGYYLSRVSADSTLNSPTALALAPTGFGSYGGDLLVAGAGGTIGAYNPGSGAFVGLLHDANGNTITINGLTGLQFGTGATLQNTLFFTAAPSASSAPSFGDISLAASDSGGTTTTTAAPEPSTWLLAGGALLLMAWRGLP